VIAAALIVVMTSGVTAEVFSQTPAPEVIAEVRIHGNLVTPDEEILKLAGITIGARFEPGLIDEVRTRLDRDGRFQDVQVLKRYASIADLSRIVIVIIANEGAVRLSIPGVEGQPIRVEKRRGLRNLMWLPILDFEDGYGVTYGVRFAFVGVTGERGRVSFPLSYGGHKRAGVEFDRVFTRGPISRVEVGTAIQQSENPAFEIDDTRKRIWARAERAAGPLRAGVTTGWQRVSFAEIRDDLQTIGADVTFDTRLNTVLPRNAVFATAAWERVNIQANAVTGIEPVRPSEEVIHRLRLDARGYLGLFGQSILVARVLREDVNRPVPPYLKSLLGGWSNLRGFEAGAFFGDTLVAGSLEVRLPISPVLSEGKLGVSAFVDAGTVYDKGQRFEDATIRTGGGGAVWVTLLAFRMGVSVAHGKGSGTRVNFGGGLSF
jgi:outer membrane protein assembly factor BamA